MPMNGARAAQQNHSGDYGKPRGPEQRKKYIKEKKNITSDHLTEAKGGRSPDLKDRIRFLASDLRLQLKSLRHESSPRDPHSVRAHVFLD